jgi:ABC-type branched-subunit amino acid transport system ATPase component
MNQGEVLMTGTPAEVRADRRVQEVYTGTGRPTEVGRAGVGAGEKCVLRFEKVNSFYGKSHILNDATLDVRDNEIVALLGRNGAGKSTLLKTLCGLVPPASGTIEFNGKVIAGLPTPDIARMGIGYVPQGRGLFAGMSVADNLALGRYSPKFAGRFGCGLERRSDLQLFPAIEGAHACCRRLSVGRRAADGRRRTRPFGNVKLLLLDEPFEGLAPAVILELFQAFNRLRKELSIIIVEHNLDLVLALADRVFVLERGAVFHTGPASPLLSDLDYRKKILWL